MINPIELCIVDVGVNAPERRKACRRQRNKTVKERAKKKKLTRGDTLLKT